MGTEEDRRAKAVEHAQQQLAEGTWPRALAVFAYQNPRAPRTNEEEFRSLKRIFVQAGLANMAAFIEMVQFDERRHEVAMSYSITTQRRQTPNEKPSVENVVFSPTIMVGTRRGVEGAAVWFKNLAEYMPQLKPMLLQLMDKTFGEALPLFGQPAKSATTQEMLKAALFGEGELLKPTAPPLKN